MVDADAQGSPATGNGTGRLRGVVNRLLDITGRFFVTVGLLMLAFVAYQLWGTGIKQAQSQKQLAADFARVSSTTVPHTSAQYDRAVLNEGDVIGRISIPTLGVDSWIVAGSKLKDLEKGPGVFLNSSMPGHLGNFAVAGHRTSYGAPFGDIDKLRKNDEFTVTSQEGSFTYTVTDSKVVEPTDVSVLRTTDPTRAVATLITCHPKWTSSQRLVVHAELTSQQTAISAPAVVSVTGSPAASVDAVTPGWFHDRSRIWPTLAWCAALLAVWRTGVWLVRRCRRGRDGSESRMLAAWNIAGTALGIVALAALFSVSLYVMFENLSGLLPANL